MRGLKIIYTLLIIVILFFTACNFFNKDEAPVFKSNWDKQNSGIFIGHEYWANRLQDWRIDNGRLVCIGGRLPLRTVHILTCYTNPNDEKFVMEIEAGASGGSDSLNEDAFCGFLIACGGNLDYKARALIHLGSGNNGGLIAGITKSGELCFWDNEDSLKVIVRSDKKISGLKKYNLRLEYNNNCLTLFLLDEKNNKTLDCKLQNIPAYKLQGGIALVANQGAVLNGESFWFNNLKLFGKKITIDNTRSFGPVAGVQYTVSNKALKLTAQFFPLSATDTREVRLEIKEMRAGKLMYTRSAQILDTSYIATFRINDFDSQLDYSFKVKYGSDKNNGGYIYEGKIVHEPTEKEELTIATLNCNNNTYRTFNILYDFDSSNLWFPHNDLVKNIKAHNPDMLINLGDQLYESRPTDADKSGNYSSYLDYLYKWYLWYWAYGELTREMPSVCLVDDHDVFQGNLWGSGGVKAREYLKNESEYPQYYKKTCIDCWNADGGGYTMPSGFVRMVEQTQTSHLPDAYDTTILPYGIKSYYTSVKYAGVDFALLEDRKFKSAPSVMLPNAWVVNGFSQLEKYDARNFDSKDAELLGKRQEEFINLWTQDWRDVFVKIAVSQTEWANVSTMPSSFKTDDSIQFIGIYDKGVIPKGYSFACDMDSDGWPQHARNTALEAIRKGFAFHVGGDQHIGMLLQHGIDKQNDASYSFCVPPVANAWPRRWFPPYEGKNKENNTPYYTGEYEDAFGNKINIKAAANPYKANVKPTMLHDLVAGYGILKVNTKKQQVKVECWPRYASPNAEFKSQFSGWPVIINIEDNYITKAPYSLAMLEIKTGDAIVQVLNSKEEIVYTIRTRKESFLCSVFKEGEYSLVIINPQNGKQIIKKNLPAVIKGKQSVLTIQF